MQDGHSWLSISISFAGGLALFLFGIRAMSAGLKKVAAKKMESFVATILNNPVYGLLAGAFATMIVQSSSTIVVILVGLVQSQLMTSTQALAVLFGAEIGTTALTQLIAFGVHEYGPLFFAAGFLLNSIAKREGLRYTGEALCGLGLLLFGLHLMTASTTPLLGYQPFIALLHNLRNPLVSVLVGLCCTAILQSSGAFIGIVITLAQQGVLTLEAGMPLLLGANIGTCITGFLASAGLFRAAKRVALAQLIFNATGVVLFIAIIPWYADVIRFISFSVPDGSSVMLAHDVPRQLANAHTVYNILMALLFLPLLPPFSRLLIRLLPDNPDEIRQVPSVWYIQESALATPSLALSYARAEVARMSRILERMVSALLYPFISVEKGKDSVFAELSVLEGITMREEKLDFLESSVSEYLIAISRRELNEEESRQVFALMNIVKNQESTGDVIEKLIGKYLQGNTVFVKGLTEEGKTELVLLHRLVCAEIETLTEALLKMKKETVSESILCDTVFLSQVSQAEKAHLKRVQSVAESGVTHNIHMDLLDVLKQVHHYNKNCARILSEFSSSAK
ncbi:MAG: Na/Pi cotransporter family protein [Chlorobium sp.]|jgi:phosphate:Na+ symporter|nr:Na/Pi cotransporter family protein [Chlorobium sp.]